LEKEKTGILVGRFEEAQKIVQQAFQSAGG
jgi:hypothetical protein